MPLDGLVHILGDRYVVGLGAPGLNIFVEGAGRAIPLNSRQVNGFYKLDEIWALTFLSKRWDGGTMPVVLVRSLQRIDRILDLLLRHFVQRYLKFITRELAELESIREFHMIRELVPER